MSKLAIGFLGCGAIASAVHLRVLRWTPGVTVVGVVDPSADARRRVESIASVPTYREPAGLLQQDLDGVVIGAATTAHAELAVAAAQAGTPIYLEKPLAATWVEAQTVREEVAGAGVPVTMGFNHRHHPLHARARALIATGVIGRIRRVETAFCEPYLERELPAWKRRRATGGGVLLDLGSHQFDLLRWLLDDEIDEVAAEIRSERSELDTASVEIGLRSGATASGFFSFCAARCDHFTFIGERGVLRLDRYAPAIELALARSDIGAVKRSRVPPGWIAYPWRVRKRLRPAFEPSYRAALHAWTSSLRSGADPALPGIGDGLASLAAVLRAESDSRSLSRQGG